MSKANYNRFTPSRLALRAVDTRGVTPILAVVG